VKGADHERGGNPERRREACTLNMNVAIGPVTTSVATGSGAKKRSTATCVLTRA
jgi:hypothetical protein